MWMNALKATIRSLVLQPEMIVKDYHQKTYHELQWTKKIKDSQISKKISELYIVNKKILIIVVNTTISRIIVNKTILSRIIVNKTKFTIYSMTKTFIFLAQFLLYHIVTGMIWILPGILPFW